MDDLKDFIEFLSNILNMEPVKFKILSLSEMKNISGSEDTLAAYDRENKNIYVLEKDEMSLMDYYLISHEVRHAWQDISNPDFYFDKYFVEQSEHDYHVSNAEIDANAFACIAIVIAFGKITKRDYTNDVVAQEKYLNKLEELKKEFDVQF